MKLPFEDHLLIKQYNEIKRYFRKYETHVSLKRIGDFHRFSKILNQLGYEAAFDFVGSINFGLTEHYSDVDFILYFNCKEHHNCDCNINDCNILKELEYLILENLMKNYIKEPYKTQIVDYINLHRLDLELNKTTNLDYDLIFRFAFYRSICRGVNLKILKYYHDKLLKRKEVLEKLYYYIDDVFKKLNETSTHNISFEKYRVRLNENGIKIPISVLDKIQNYLYQKNNYSI